MEECVEIPKEVCVRAKVNPRKEKRPIIKKWCYTPTDNITEGLEPETDIETTIAPIDNSEDADVLPRG